MAVVTGRWGTAGLLDDADRQRAERARALEEQRMLLLELQGDVTATLHRLTAGPPAQWRSESARRYAGQREQLCDEVRQLLWAIDEAVQRVAAMLSTLTTAG